MEHQQTLDIEALKEEAVAALIQDCEPFLEQEVASKRLDGLRKAKVLNSTQLVEEVERATGLKLPEDKVGGIIIFDGDDQLGRRAVLEDVESPLVAYHTAVHEGVHLLGPDSRKGTDIHERKYILKSLGPKWTTLYLNEEGKVVDTQPIQHEEKLFWEAVTDFVAAKKTSEKFGSEETDRELIDEGKGFIQRYWIDFLVKSHPNPDELLKTLKQALYQGSEIEFLRVLGGRLDNPHVPFYHTLAAYMKEGDDALEEGRSADYNAALEKWMTAIRYHFANGGAYSLNMEHF